MTEIKELPLSDLLKDKRLQRRVDGINGEVANNYAEALREGATFPPILVYTEDDKRYRVVDGFHRLGAYASLRRTTIPAEVHRGTFRDALLASVAVNASHGSPRTSDDKRAAVMTLITDEEWSGWSDGEIAKRCLVSPHTVAKHRASLGTVHSEERTYTTKHGTVATMRTAKIGKPHAVTIKADLTNLQTLVEAEFGPAFRPAVMVKEIVRLRRLLQDQPCSSTRAQL